MNIIQITELSLVIFAQFILCTLFALYLTLVPRKVRETYLVATVFWGGAFFALTLFFALSLRHLVPIHAFIIPLQYFPVSIAVAALMQLAYTFPREPQPGRSERNIILFISIAISLYILGSTVYRPLVVDRQETEIFSLLIILEFIWAIMVLFRRYVIYLFHLELNHFPLRQLLNNKIAKTFHSLFILLTIPIIIALVTLFRDIGLLPLIVADYALAIGGLLFIFLLLTVYLNHSGQNSSIQINLVAYTLLMVLIFISSIGFLMTPIFRAEYSNSGFLSEGQTISYSRSGAGYRVEAADINFDKALGTQLEPNDQGYWKIALPFAFPYFDDRFETLYIDPDRIVTFDERFSFHAFRDKLQPGIAALAIDMDEDRFPSSSSGIYYKTEEESVTITWFQLFIENSDEIATVQLKLTAEGEIETRLQAHPFLRSNSRNPLGSGWVIGIQSGQWEDHTETIRFARDLPYRVGPDTSLVEDYHLRYRQYLSTRLWPLLRLMLLACLIIIPLYPLLIRTNIIRPINALVTGFDRVNDGELETNLSIQTRNELGYLTRSFNKTVESIRQKNRQLHQYSEELEKKVDARTIQLIKAKDEAEKARLQAENANEIKSKFVANVSHEIRTPLNAIVGYSDILSEDAASEGKESWIEDLSNIKKAAMTLLNMINDILDMSKIEAGKITVYMESFDLADLLSEIIDLMEPIAEARGNRFRFDTGSDRFLMVTDYIKVRQIFQNLISNANKFTEDGIIYIRVTREQPTPEPQSAAAINVNGNENGLPNGSHGGDSNGEIQLRQTETIKIEIADSGIGMTPNQIARIFQPFQQADDTISKHYGGTGLGLAITHQLCRVLGGNISVRSELGRGSIFTVRLPTSLKESIATEREMRLNGSD